MYGFCIRFQSRCIRKLAGSPNHLIGLEEECWGNRQPKSLSGLQVDDELELHMGVPIGRPGIEEEGHSVECAAVNPTLYTREEFGTKLHARDWPLGLTALRAVCEARALRWQPLLRSHRVQAGAASRRARDSLRTI